MKPFDPAKTPIGTKVYLIQCEEGTFVRYDEETEYAYIFLHYYKHELKWPRSGCIEMFKVD